MMMEKIAGKRVLILGLGESNLAAIRFLCAEKARVALWDSRESPPFLEEIKNLPVDFQKNSSLTAENFKNFDFAVIAPGLDFKTLPIPSDFPVFSEIELFSWAVQNYCPQSQILGITGSNGKTTTTLLTAHLLNAANKKAIACGNISPSALNAFLTAKESDDFPAVWVLELSSFQLEKTFSLAPAAAVILNITEDHLDRYNKDFAEYAAAKWRIFKNAKSKVFCDAAFFKKNTGLPWKNADLRLLGDKKDFWVSQNGIFKGDKEIVALKDLKMLGIHNAINAAAALMLCESVGVFAESTESVVNALKNFEAPPHRVQKVLTKNGIDFIDDSKGTNVGATLAALESLESIYQKIAIVLGGDGKGQDFAPLKSALEKSARAVAFIGKDGAKIAEVCALKNVPCENVKTLKNAIPFLMQFAENGDCVLLSPACASLDQYPNYLARAIDFLDCAKNISGEQQC